MTREQLIKHWDVITAFKEGKEIEFSLMDGDGWNTTDTPDFKNDVEYRVKQKTEYVPFDFSDAEKLIGKAVKNNDGSLFLITTFTIVGFEIGNTAISFNDLFDNFIFLDGSPCGKIKE